MERRLGSSKVGDSTISIDIHSSGVAKTEITSVPSIINNINGVAPTEESSTMEVDKIQDLLCVEFSDSRDANQNLQTPEDPTTQSTGFNSTMFIDFEMDNADAGWCLDF